MNRILGGGAACFDFDRILFFKQALYDLRDPRKNCESYQEIKKAGKIRSHPFNPLYPFLNHPTRAVQSGMSPTDV
jgi:hypothetical protein